MLADGRLYVPVASLEEPESGQADYTCCTFRGYLSALNAATGESIWKTYTIAEKPQVSGRNSRGKDMLGPSGAGIWVTPVLDLKRRALYFGTGNAFSGTPRTANAIMAVSMDTGKVLWSMQALPLDVWHNGCPQTIPGRGAGPPGRGGPPAGGRRARRWARRHSVPAGELSRPHRTGLGLLGPAGAGHHQGRPRHPHRAAEAGAGLGDQPGHRRGAVEAGRRA